MKPFIAGGTLMFALFSCAGFVRADHAIEEVHVTGRQDHQVVDVLRTPAPEVDSTALLRKLPGANINGNGPLSGIAQYRGMYGNRVAVAIDGAQFTSGGPNLMDPPLHYAPAAMLESLIVYRGAAPVSAAQVPGQMGPGLSVGAAVARRAGLLPAPGSILAHLAGHGKLVKGLAGRSAASPCAGGERSVHWHALPGAEGHLGRAVSV